MNTQAAQAYPKDTQTKNLSTAAPQAVTEADTMAWAGHSNRSSVTDEESEARRACPENQSVRAAAGEDEMAFESGFGVVEGN